MGADSVPIVQGKARAVRVDAIIDVHEVPAYQGRQLSACKVMCMAVARVEQYRSTLLPLILLLHSPHAGQERVLL